MTRDPWEVWRALQRHLPASGLRALLAALREDSHELIQTRTVIPSPRGEYADHEPRAACPVGYALWRGLGLATTAQVDAEYSRVCWEADRDFETVAVHNWLNEYDCGDRREMFARLAVEVAAYLERTEATECPPADGGGA